MEPENEDAKFSSIMGPDFVSLFAALQGVTVLTEPRVPRETIIAVLRKHTTILSELRSEVVTLNGKVTELMEGCQANKSAIHLLKLGYEEANGKIFNLEEQSALFRCDITRIQSVLGDLSSIKDDIRDQQIRLQELDTKVDETVVDVKQHLADGDEKMSAMDSMNKDSLRRLMELKEYVDHFGDNLILASSQITVESTVGFSDRPMPLRDTLRRVNKIMAAHELAVNEHAEQIASASNEIQTKADATVVMDVVSTMERVKVVEEHLKKEEEQGISAIRKGIDNLTVSTESIIADLSEKVDFNTVDSIVHAKYEDIVQYLQHALDSHSRDEDNFNLRAKETHEEIKQLAAGKADRIEIQLMQEVIVKIEAMLNKSTNISLEKFSTKLKDLYTRMELDVLLSDKVDKSEMNSFLKSVNKNFKKGQKQATLGGGLLTSTDMAARVDDMLVKTNQSVHSSNTTTSLERNIHSPGHFPSCLSIPTNGNSQSVEHRLRDQSVLNTNGGHHGSSSSHHGSSSSLSSENQGVIIKAQRTRKKCTTNSITKENQALVHCEQKPIHQAYHNLSEMPPARKLDNGPQLNLHNDRETLLKPKVESPIENLVLSLGCNESHDIVSPPETILSTGKTGDEERDQNLTLAVRNGVQNPNILQDEKHPSSYNGESLQRSAHEEKQRNEGMKGIASVKSYIAPDLVLSSTPDSSQNFSVIGGIVTIGSGFNLPEPLKSTHGTLVPLNEVVGGGPDLEVRPAVKLAPFSLVSGGITDT
jgi:hypothetical protein